MDDGVAECISCPSTLCTVVIDDVTVLKLLEDEDAQRKYKYLLARDFVENNKLMKWCPSRDCDQAICAKAFSADPEPVTCTKCTQVWCFTCQDTVHTPISCTMMKRWRKKCSDDSETANWIMANTKDCPKCSYTIEKNGGCNHMVCRNCKYDFCWLCMGEWSKHGTSWYRCNQYDDAQAKEERDKQQSSRRVLDRYLHHFSRFSEHEKSAKLEGKLELAIRDRKQELQGSDFSWIEVQFLGKAFDVLKRCRRVLKSTYVFGYYLVPCPAGELFADNQQKMEHATEVLSGFLETKITAENSREIKSKVLDQTVFCDKLVNILVSQIEDGYTEGLWKTTELTDTSSIVLKAS